MQTYKDKIVFEATGHEHLMSLRYSKVDEQNPNSQNFLNKVIFPAVTATSRTNPGYSTFLYNTVTGQAENLKSSYLQVSKTYDLPESTLFTELPFFEVDFAEKYGLKNLSGDSMEDLVKSLKADKTKAKEYYFNSIGVDIEDED